MGMHLWQVLRWVREDRDVLTCPEKYVTAVKEECADFMQQGFAQSAAQAGPYPIGGKQEWQYQFVHTSMHEKLQRIYSLNKIAGEGADFDRVLQVMDWLCTHTQYNGMSIWSAYLFQRHENSLRMLRYAYDKSFARALNCKHRALLLADCLLALGMPSLPLWLRNVSPQEDGSVVTFKHCVVHAWLANERCWVMLDPSFNAFVTDERGDPLHLVDIHERHRQGQSLLLGRYSFNGTQDCESTYLEGFLLASLQCIFVRNSTKDSHDPRNCLSPEDAPHENNKIHAITMAELLAEPLF